MKYFLSFIFILSSGCVNINLAAPANLNVSSRNSPDFRRFIYWPNEEGNLVLTDLKAGPILHKAQLSDVTYYFYGKKNPNDPYIIHNNDVSELDHTFFDPNKETIVISHGWNNDYSSRVNKLVKTAILEAADRNVFVVDWSGPANSNYLTAMDAVPIVGQFIAEFIQAIINKYSQVNEDHFILIGHSLGAHVVGCAGSALNGKPRVIIGLDPAGPLFTEGNIENRLDITDAKFVHVIHTNDALLGWGGNSIGSADYYPNGGKRQPGCGIDLTGTCSHGRSYQYLAESIRRNDDAFMATKCESYKIFQKEECLNNQKSRMGTIDIDTKVKGEFYLYTNDEEPFGLGD